MIMMIGSCMWDNSKNRLHNFFFFLQVRETTMKEIGMREDDSRQASFKLSPKTVGRVRVAIRRSGYLSDPEHSQSITDIDK